MKNFAVYTAFSRGYDTLQPVPRRWRKEASFTAFLENRPRLVRGWEIKPLHQGFIDPCRNAKIHKILSHVYFPSEEYTLWTDGSIAITSKWTVRKLVREYLSDCDIVVFKHRRRQCIYAEAKECIAQKKDAPAIIRRQIRLYRSENYPVNHGLIEGCVILRRHTPKIIRFNELWHQLIMNYSRRDQLSFNYVAHTLNVKFHHWPGIYTQNPHFTFIPHVAERRKT